MNRVDVFVDSILKHAFYDPVKAHEYYIQNRELTGRDAAAPVKAKAKESQRISEGVGYVKSQIGAAKKQDLKIAAEESKAEIAAIREVATERRVEIRDKLKDVFAQLAANRKDVLKRVAESAKELSAEITEDRKIELARIVKEMKDKIDALPPVPTGLGKEATKRLSLERGEKLAQIRGDASVARDTANTVANQQKADLKDNVSETRDSVSEEVANQKQSERDSSDSERKQLSADMKESIDSARENYAALKEDLKSKYEAASVQEFRAIRNAGPQR